MSGEYGKIFRRAWGDPDFRALPEAAQSLYMKLVSQPDISLAGVLTFAPQRWATQTAGLTLERVLEGFGILRERRFVILDADTQEVLVRSYIRNDDAWRSPRTVIAIRSAVERILSRSLLRRVLSHELGRLDMTQVSSVISEKTGRSSLEIVEPAIRSLIVGYEPLDTLSATCSGVADTLSDTLSAVRSGSLTATATATAPATAPATAQAEQRSSATTSPDRDPFEEFWDVYDKKRDKKTALQKWKLAVKKPGITPEYLIEAAGRYVAAQKRAEAHPQFTMDPARWLGKDRWTDEEIATGSPAANHAYADIIAPDGSWIKQEPEDVHGYERFPDPYDNEDVA